MYVEVESSLPEHAYDMILTDIGLCCVLPWIEISQGIETKKMRTPTQVNLRNLSRFKQVKMS